MVKAAIRLAFLLASLICSALLAVAATTVAVAAPADSAGTTTAIATLSNGKKVNSTAVAREGADYWTPERMKRAIPIPDPPAPDPARTAPPGARGGPTGPSGSTPPASAIASAANSLAGGDQQLAAAINESAAAGKVFFRKPSGGDFSCSANALNSPSKQLVITAGHCVHEGRGGNFMQNWVFVPRYRNGVRPFGTFSAKQFITFTSWINNSDLSRDVGMVTTFPLNGNKLVNVVGGNGLAWNQSRAVDVTILAYPSNFGGGQSQFVCQGRTSDGGGGTIKIGCNFGPGSSGSAWLLNFNNSNGLGLANGAMSTIDTAGVNRSSYFDTAVMNMFNTQGSVT